MNLPATQSLDPNSMNESATHVVVLTPGGRGAVATLLVEGPQAQEFVSRSFRPRVKRSLLAFNPGRIVFGNWSVDEAEPHDAAKRFTGEELVVCRLDEQRVEVHCHGSRAAVDNIVTSLTRLGAVARSWQEHAQATASDATAAAANVALASALTERSASILLDQAAGALSVAVRDIDQLLAKAQLTKAVEHLHKLLERAPLGRHLTQPWKVVLSGSPNVGKSSLLNRLLGYERAIVFNQPGTTRDVVASLTSVNGWPIDLADTAGLRDSRDAIEHAGIEHAHQQLAEADLVLFVNDASVKEAHPALAELAASTAKLTVHNKVDLLDKPLVDYDGIATSAVTGEGIGALRAAIARCLVPKVPEVGAPVPFTADQVQTLDQAREHAEQGDGSSARLALRP